jgi:hypothetical protein
MKQFKVGDRVLVKFENTYMFKGKIIQDLGCNLFLIEEILTKFLNLAHSNFLTKINPSFLHRGIKFSYNYSLNTWVDSDYNCLFLRDSFFQVNCYSVSLDDFRTFFGKDLIDTLDNAFDWINNKSSKE